MKEQIESQNTEKNLFLKNLLQGIEVEYESIGNLITRVREKGKQDDKIKTVYSVSNLLGLVKAEDFRKNTIHSSNTSNYTIVKQGMFAYNPARLNIGSIGYFKNDLSGLVSPMYVVFKIDKNRILKEYLYLFIKSKYCINKINSLTESGARFRFDFERWGLINIPLPPIPVQKEIVRILDKFTKHKAELIAELTARKQQYIYYREQLFSFEESEVDWKSLNEIGEFQRGKRFVRTDLISQGVPTIHYGEMYTHYGTWAAETKSFVSEELVKNKNLRVAEKGDVIIVAAGETIEDLGKGTAWLGNEGVVIHDACFSFRSPLHPKYVAYFTRTRQYHDQIRKHISSGKISAINSKGLSKVIIPVPSKDEQERIITILDKFDILTTSISEGLPKEIELRKKQYEYYRDLLLTFPKDNIEE